MPRYFRQWTLGAIAACALNCSAALADWEDTRWGMSADEVRSVVSGLRDWFTEPDAIEKVKPFKIPFWTQMVLENHVYIVEFLFLEEKLAAIHMTLLDATCDKLAIEFFKKHGPTEKLDTDFGTMMQWRAGNDRIRLNHFTKSQNEDEKCLLTYSDWRLGAG